jgi:hypothetical protein
VVDAAGAALGVAAEGVADSAATLWVPEVVEADASVCAVATAADAATGVAAL